MSEKFNGIVTMVCVCEHEKGAELRFL